jgi:hypothetical protein
MILCADDFGLTGDIDECIIDLATHGRLTAVSCMAALASCQAESLRRLMEAAPRVAVGLHVTLTGPDPQDYARPASSLRASDGLFMRYRSLLMRAMQHRIDQAEALAEIRAQYDLFLRKAGRRPDFIDGHLHVHQLPGIRAAIVQFVLSLPPADRPYVRNTCTRLSDAIRIGVAPAKCLMIGGPGRRLRRMLLAAGLSTNTRFAGVYNYNHWPRFPQYFAAFRACCCGDRDLVMVHPGRGEPWRRMEYETLSRMDPIQTHGA